MVKGTEGHPPGDKELLGDRSKVSHQSYEIKWSQEWVLKLQKVGSLKREVQTAFVCEGAMTENNNSFQMS